MIVEISDNNSIDIIGTGNFFSGTNFSVGTQIDTKKSSFNLSGIYQFGGNWWGAPPYYMKYHLLGIKLKYRVLNIERRVSPFFEITGLTEVGTNYRDSYISYSWRPTTYASEFSNLSYSSRFYAGTPFVGNLLLGCDIRLVHGLHLNISAGYGLRVMLTRYAIWSKGYMLSKEQIHERSVSTKNLHMLDFQLGLSYAFSFKKKTKNI
ncbi:MAG: hypothetical protein BGO87_14555 [Flavobacteriia bacterium 40-80]|nr:MAG: hypothetical protein BGO87_14555 [Flavobacteriia bacterium 40-80]